MLIEKAIQFAAVAHQQQYRKGTAVPYIVHPVSVGFLLKDIDCDDDVIAAGILHDVVEDTDAGLKDIEREFGKRIALLVESVTEPDKSLPWEVRKSHTINGLEHASEETMLLTLADKISNLRAMNNDLQEQGDTVWERFKRGKSKQHWYHESIYKMIEKRAVSEQVQNLKLQYRYLINEVFGK